MMWHGWLAVVVALSIGGSPVLPEKTVMLPGNVPLKLLRIPAGSFVMGSEAGEAGRQGDEGPRHRVTIGRDFYLGQYEITQGQWKAVMGSNPSVFRDRESADSHPVEMVSWEDAQQFLRKLNDLKLGEFRLPTEAEWEYACRAGTETRYSFADDPDYRLLPQHAWFYSRAEGRSQPVGTRKPNPWGLHDMHGNVWEWCADWFGPYTAEERTDPTGPEKGDGRVIRGGSWFNEPEALRSANRHRHPIDSRQTNLGFRVVMASPGTMTRI